MLALLDGARAGAFCQNGVDFIFGDGGFLALLHAQQLQQALRGDCEQQHKGLGDLGQEVDGASHQAGNHFRIGLAQTLGYQFTHHDRQIGNHHHHDDHGQRICGSHAQAKGFQPVGEGASQSGLTKNTAEHTNGGDANLDGGEKARRVFAELERCSCGGIALINQLL